MGNYGCCQSVVPHRCKPSVTPAVVMGPQWVLSWWGLLEWICEGTRLCAWYLEVLAVAIWLFLRLLGVWRGTKGSLRWLWEREGLLFLAGPLVVWCFGWYTLLASQVLC